MKLELLNPQGKNNQQILGSDHNVLASYGLLGLLAKKGSVDPEQDFAMTWSRSSSTKPPEKLLALKKSDELILATDPDREVHIGTFVNTTSKRC